LEAAGIHGVEQDRSSLGFHRSVDHVARLDFGQMRRSRDVYFMTSGTPSSRRVVPKSTCLKPLSELVVIFLALGRRRACVAPSTDRWRRRGWKLGIHWERVQDRDRERCDASRQWRGADLSSVADRRCRLVRSRRCRRGSNSQTGVQSVGTEDRVVRVSLIQRWTLISLRLCRR
jgi:hypothetical protein